MSRKHSSLSIQGRALWTVCAAAVSMLAAAAHADAPVVEKNVVEKVVRYADLDPSRSPDAATLYARLERAADAVCGQADARDLTSRRMQKQCRQQALDSAVERVGSIALKSVHDSEGRVQVAQRGSDDPSRI